MQKMTKRDNKMETSDKDIFKIVAEIQIEESSLTIGIESAGIDEIPAKVWENGCFHILPEFS